MRMGTCRSYDVVMGPPLCVFQTSLDVQNLERLSRLRTFGGAGSVGEKVSSMHS